MPSFVACRRQRPHNSSTPPSRNTVGVLASLTSLAFCSRTKAPPPRAMIFWTPVRNSPSNSFRAACSARRNSASPKSRKISCTPRCSRRSMRWSRSSNLQARHSLRARPTLLLPAPMKPIRITALIWGPRWPAAALEPRTPIPEFFAGLSGDRLR